MDTGHQNQPPRMQEAVILAVHGSASSGKQWRALAELLEGSARVCAPDLPGYSTRVEDRSCRLKAVVELTAGFGRPVHVVAHSFGCAVALRLAQELPHHVASLSLYDPVVPVATDAGRPSFPAGLQTLLDDGRGADDATLMKAFMGFWAGAGSWTALHPGQRARLIEMAAGLRRDFAEAEAGLWSLPRQSFRGPVSILCGGHSPDVTIEMAAHLFEALPQAELTWLAGHGHLAPLTEAGAIARYSANCLRAHGANLPRPTTHLSQHAA